jgi:hypothetical protein
VHIGFDAKRRLRLLDFVISTRFQHVNGLKTANTDLPFLGFYLNLASCLVNFLNNVS